MPKAKAKDTRTLAERLEDRCSGKFQAFGGTPSDDFNHAVLLQAMGSTWRPKEPDEAERDRTFYATAMAMAGFEPTSAVEGMAAAQLVALHNAAMECARRAMIPDQTLDGRKMNLDAANKCSRTFAVLIDALNKHRGKGQQTVRVEHVTVDARQQTVNLHPAGGGVSSRSEEQSHAPVTISHGSRATLRGSDAIGCALPVAGSLGAEALPDARRDQSRRSARQP